MSNEFNWNAYRAKELQGRFLVAMIGGMLVSGLGFMLPWFSFDEGDEVYGGWYLLRDESDYTLMIVVAIALYGLLFFIGLSRRFHIVQAILATLIVFVTISVVVLSAANATAIVVVDDEGPLVLGFGLLLMFVGHGVMLIASIINAVLGTIHELL
jgi:hypothetical protein